MIIYMPTNTPTKEIKTLFFVSSLGIIAMFSKSCPLLYKHKDALWISHKYILCNWQYEHSHRKYRMALKSSWSISIINNIIQKKWAVIFFISTDKTLLFKTNKIHNVSLKYFICWPQLPYYHYWQNVKKCSHNSF